MELVISKDWPRNLLTAVIGDEVVNNEALPIDINPTIDYVMYSLTDQEQHFIRHHFQYGLTQTKVGEIFGVTRERVRQVIAKACRKLKWRDRRILLTHGIKVHLDLNRDITASDGPHASNEPETVYDRGIDYLGLSIRAYNGLSRANATTIKDVVDLFKDGQIGKIRGVGVGSIEEIKNKLIAATIPEKELQFDEEKYRARVAAAEKISVTDETIAKIHAGIAEIKRLQDEANMLPGWDLVIRAMRSVANHDGPKDVVGVIVKVQDNNSDEEGTSPWGAYIEQVSPEVRQDADYNLLNSLRGISIQRVGFKHRYHDSKYNNLVSTVIENLCLTPTVTASLRASGISTVGQAFSAVALNTPAINNEYKNEIARRLIQIGLGTVSIKMTTKPYGEIRIPAVEPFMEELKIETHDDLKKVGDDSGVQPE